MAERSTAERSMMVRAVRARAERKPLAAQAPALAVAPPPEVPRTV